MQPCVILFPIINKTFSELLEELYQLTVKCDIEIEGTYYLYRQLGDLYEFVGKRDGRAGILPINEDLLDCDGVSCWLVKENWEFTVALFRSGRDTAFRVNLPSDRVVDDYGEEWLVGFMLSTAIELDTDAAIFDYADYGSINCLSVMQIVAMLESQSFKHEKRPRLVIINKDFVSPATIGNIKKYGCKMQVSTNGYFIFSWLL